MWSFVLALIGVVAAVEVGARLCGLGRPVLYEKTAYGYRVVPSQSLKRFGNRVYYNAQGMRSEPTADTPAPGTLRILCIGDSITFGSTATDQRRTYPYLLQEMLNAASGNARFEVLNISAGGWAMENEEGWLLEHGIYGSQVVVLQVATHDLFQEKAGSEVVGTHPSFPERPPATATQELLVRYVLPRLSARLKLRDPGEVIYHHDIEDVERTMATLERIHRYVEGRGAQLYVLLVEQPRALEPDDQLTRYAKRRLYNKIAELRVVLLQPARVMEEAGGQAAFFDGLHPNATGNRVLAEEVAAAIAARFGVPKSTVAPAPVVELPMARADGAS